MTSEIAVVVLLGLSAVTLVSGLLALSAWLANLTGGGDRKTSYSSKLFAGVAYVSLGLSGIVASAYVDENRLLTYLLSWAFLIMGGFVFRSGWRERRSS
jgi:hypothetical protein